MKKTSSVWYVIAIVIMLTGFFRLVGDGRYIVDALTDNYTNLNDVLADESLKDIPKGYYYLEMDAVFECFAVKEESSKVKEACYVIWLGDGSVAPILVAGVNMDALNTLADGTWDYLNGTADSLPARHMQGIVKTSVLEPELRTLYYETLDDIGVDADRFVIREVLLDFENGSSLKRSVVGGFIIFLVGFAIIVITLAVIKISGYRASKPYAVKKPDRYVVTGKVAAARITETRIKKCYNTLKLSTVISFAAVALAIVVPAGMYVYKITADNDFPIGNITFVAVFSLAVVVCGLTFGIFVLGKLKYMINGLRQFNDSEYSQFEREMASASTKSYPQNLYLTENYLVMLAPFSFDKDVIDSHNAILFTRYRDIVWMYPYNSSINYYRNIAGVVQNIPTDTGIAICGPGFGKSIIIRLSVYKNRGGIVSFIYKTLEERCPGALMGYTKENKLKAEQIISNM